MEYLSVNLFAHDNKKSAECTFIAYEKGRINGRLIRSVRQALEQYSLHTRLVRVKMTVLEGLERRQRQYVRMEKSASGRRGGQSFRKGPASCAARGQDASA